MLIHTVWKSGNSLVITIPHKIATSMRFTEGTAVTFRKTPSGCLSIKPNWLRPVRDTPQFQRPLSPRRS